MPWIQGYNLVYRWPKFQHNGEPACFAVQCIWSLKSLRQFQLDSLSIYQHLPIAIWKYCVGTWITWWYILHCQNCIKKCKKITIVTCQFEKDIKFSTLFAVFCLLALVRSIQLQSWKSCRVTSFLLFLILRPGGPLVFKGGYHALVWPLKTDPKQGF